MSRPGTLRVVAGSHRGRRFASPPGTDTRPTTDRVRQAVFNALESMDAVRGATVLDAFAGSGALGIEALSRGAVHVTFAETDHTARSTIGRNLAALDLVGRATVMSADGARLLGAGGPWDLVLADPPYSYDGWDALLASASERLSPHGVLVLESDRAIVLPAALQTARTRAYGSTVVTFAVRAGATS